MIDFTTAAVQKIALSLFVVAASGAYLWDRSGRSTPDDLLAMPLPSADGQAASVPEPLPALSGSEPAGVVRPALLIANQPSGPISPDKPPTSYSVSPTPVEAVSPQAVPLPETRTLVNTPPTAVAPPDTHALADPPSPLAAPSSLLPPPVHVPLPRLRPKYEGTRMASRCSSSRRIAGHPCA
jgi:hypothetical protein